jgi:hypothetical protein
MWLNAVMDILLIAFWVLAACNIGVFGLSLYAHARVVATDRALKELDWETLSNLTGEIGAMKRSLQKTNNRISGMTASDPMAALAELPKLQSVTKDNGTRGMGG